MTKYVGIYWCFFETATGTAAAAAPATTTSTITIGNRTEG